MKMPSQNVATTNVDTIYFYLSFIQNANFKKTHIAAKILQRIEVVKWEKFTLKASVCEFSNSS